MKTIKEQAKTIQTNSIEMLMIVILLAVFLSPFQANAQDKEIRYEDLYNTLPTLQPQQAFSRLSAFQAQDPHFANTYIQMGNICEKIFRSVDPIRDYDMATYWISNAVLYYSILPAYAKSNEGRSNREYYANIPIPAADKKVQTEDILAYVKARIESCKNFQDSLNKTFAALTNSKNSYNRCIEIFNDINNRYSSYNEALLKANPAFYALMDSLKANNDRCLQSFEAYKKLTKAFPLQGYYQTYTLKPIETFRLDGIANSDFLLNRITLWDFNKWIENFNSIYSSDIVKLRNEVTSIWKTMEDTKQYIKTAPDVSQDTLPKVDELFLFRLGKYDGNSLVRELFDYLSARQDYLVLQKSAINTATDSASAVLGKKLRYYYKLSQQMELTNKKLEKFESSISAEKVERFYDFFNDNFKGEAGLKHYTQQESVQMKQDFNHGLENLYAYIENEKAFARKQGYSSGAKGVTIPLFLMPDSLQDQVKTGYITTSVSYEKGVPAYVCGKLKKANGQVAAFVAKVGQGKNTSWVKEVANKEVKEHGSNYAALVQSISGGCVAVVTGVTGDSLYSSLIRFNDKGQEILNKPMVHQAPALLQFDDIAQEYTMIFGQKEIPTTSKFDSFTFCKADSLGSLKVNQVIPVSGYPVNLVKRPDSYILFANYTSYNHNATSAPQGGSGHLILKLSLDGKVLKDYPIADSPTLLVNQVFPISTEEYSLTGREQQSNKIRYFILDKDINLLFKN